MTDYKALLREARRKLKRLWERAAMEESDHELEWAIDDALAEPDELDALKAERDSFYMDYRMKCDVETKAMHNELDALRKDAARYQWLRSIDRYVEEDGSIYVRKIEITGSVMTGSSILVEDDLDNAIDAAIAAEGTK